MSADRDVLSEVIPSGEAAGKLFDREIVAEVIAFIGRETYEQLLHDFAANLDEKLRTLHTLTHTATEQGDEAARLAHRLKGAAQSLGLRPIADLFGQLVPRREHQVTPETIETALAQLSGASAELVNGLDRQIGTHSR